MINLLKLSCNHKNSYEHTGSATLEISSLCNQNMLITCTKIKQTMCLVLYILFFNGEIIVCIPVLLFWLNICHAATHESQIKENLSHKNVMVLLAQRH